MQVQHSYDKSYALGLSALIKTDDISMYYNEMLTCSLIELLREYFPKDKSNFCEIEFYCYILDFGKNGEEYESVEDFYDRLIGN